MSASTGSIAAFSVEPYLAICRPLRARALCTAARAKRIAAWGWLGTGAYCVLWLFLVDTHETAYADRVQVQRSTAFPLRARLFPGLRVLPRAAPGLAAVFHALKARSSSSGRCLLATRGARALRTRAAPLVKLSSPPGAGEAPSTPGSRGVYGDHQRSEPRFPLLLFPEWQS